MGFLPLIGQKVSPRQPGRRVKLHGTHQLLLQSILGADRQKDTDGSDGSDRQRGPRGGFDKVEVKAFYSSLFLPFCLLNGSLGGLRSAGVRTKSRPKKGPTYPDKR